MSNKRNSSFELLRIISMYLIIVHHFVVHGITQIGNTHGLKRLTMLIMQSGGKVGVNVFVMIGAYFLVEKKFKFSRIIKISLISIFYSWAIFIVFFLSGKIIISYKWYEILIPVPGTYWFVGSYIVLMFASPILNKLINNSSKRQYKNMIFFLLVIWSIVPTFLISNMVDLGLSHSELGNSTVSSFVLDYLIIGYIKKYPNNYTESKKISWLVFFSGISIMILTFYFESFYMYKNQVVSEYINNFMNLNSFFEFWISVGLILIFKNITPFNNKFINIISGSTFAVYLIHDNQFIRPILWQKVNNAQYQSSIDFLINGLEISLLIFIICIVLDMIRRILLGNLFSSMSQKIGNYLDRKIE
ncbi:acyltransferase family protein [Ligilactobacillus salivarius]|uniref:acyltransferase n=1 Tax=Ligilactobacillus salivarius TaxID=1624 RepID=UPI00339BF5B2